jgi:cobaltochelatase CobN
VARNLVFRADGKMVNVARKQGQLFVCADGCCCGHTERGTPSVPRDLYDSEWERRRLRNKVHLTIAGCLGPCPLANVILLLFDGHHIWFHSISEERQVLALYDYIEQMLAADSYLPPPPALADYHFTSFVWDGHADAAPEMDRRERSAVERSGILILTQADTDLLAFAAAQQQLPRDFPPIRVINPSYLKGEADIDAFLDQELPSAEAVILRLIGGRSSFAHGVDRIVAEAERDGFWLACLPGTDALDPELTALSNVGVPVAHELFAYLQYGGVENYAQALRFLADHLLTTGFGYDLPADQPRHGIYHPNPRLRSLDAWRKQRDPARPALGVLFYRSHLLSGNTAFVDALVRAGEAAGMDVLPVYAYSLKEPNENGVPAPLSYFMDGDRPAVDVILSTMSFAMGGVNPDGPTLSDWSAEQLERLDVPVLQAVTASSTRAQWEASLRGLSPLDTAMNVAIPEFDGRIITVPISFKETVAGADGAQAAVRYVPDEERIDRVIGLAARLAALRRKPNSEKRIAFVLTNQAARASRIGNAVGLDAPASLLRIFAAMRNAGYRIENVPEHGDTLIHALIDRCSYDTELLTESQLASAAARVGMAQYRDWFAELPEQSRSDMAARWGAPPGQAYVHDGALALAGLEFGNVAVFLQPPRGYGMDPNAIYHMPDLPPPHHYHALYRWLRDPNGWGADAIVHAGKHGTLEWLPGKAVGPGPTCFPDQILGDLPLIYPFIINDPGEGAQAKRRAHAVIVDHMTPPMTCAGLYGELAEMAQLVDEYYQVELLDPEKAPLLQRQIWDVLQRANLGSELATLLNRNAGDHTHEWDPTLTEEGAPASMAEMRGKDFAHLLQEIDGYLCELAGAEIRDGLHILGVTPEGTQLVELLFHLVRLPNLDVPALPDAVGTARGIDLARLRAAPGERLGDVVAEPLPESNPHVTERIAARLQTASDVIESVDEHCRSLLAALQEAGFSIDAIDPLLRSHFDLDAPTADVRTTLAFVCRRLVPNLRRNQEEIEHLLSALDGRYVPAGPSGAPTRGMAHVLPTGRNFYAVDPRTLPSLAAHRVGEQLAGELLKRHLQEEGRYPECVGISIWGTSAMRTHGDDIAEVFALLGVRPRWQPENRRLLGVEAIPLDELGRPRIDVVCRISGFFRDAFPHLINLLDEAVQLVAGLDEPLDQNFVRARSVREQQRLEALGAPEETAARRSRYRIFGCKPGSYGAGILPLIDERNWQGVSDFAEAYVNWGGYAYSADEFGTDARDDFRQQLGSVAVAVKNQDNREHDIFDSDDYLQYHGGMIATIRALSGQAPRRYFGDSADPRNPRVRDLREEARRVFRTRVVNPKWLESIRRHGYKGGLELAATVDYLFGYDATADVVDDWMYAGLAQKYVLDPAQQDFLRASNPWALHDIAGRLLEAVERGLWQRPDPELLDQLRASYLDADSEIEGR